MVGLKKLNVKVFWKNSSYSQKIIFIIYVIAFSIATSTHVFFILKHGFIPSNGKPLWVNIYWTSLTFADPLAIILLKIGIISYALIIISDATINLYFTISYSGLLDLLNIFMLGQILFLIILITTWRILWPKNYM